MDDLEFDRKHIWHPYTSMVNPLIARQVVSADGVRLKLADGRELVDGMSSWWCAIHGYNHPVLNAAVADQTAKMAHVMFGGLTHEPAIELAKSLIELTPASLERVFFCDSGSVSVEVAIKMAIQFWVAQNKPNKSRLMTVRGGYHGDTFAAMSICDPVNGMHHQFSSVLPKQLFVERPSPRFGQPCRDADIAELASALERHSHETAAVVLEPIVQGAGGMWFYSPDYLSRVAALCREHDVLLILDEIATGFGRTGRMFACQHANVEPDIICLGKALTGGYLSLAATLTTKRIADGISANGGVLMHGPTFMANPLACSVANASVKLLAETPWNQRVVDIESTLLDELSTYRDHAAVQDVRVLGAIGVVQTNQPVPVARVQDVFVEAGVWIRPFRDLIYVMPPFIIKPDDLSRLTSAIGLALDVLEN